MDKISIFFGVEPPSWREPMLAPHQQATPELIDFPALVSPKLDGIRCLIFPHEPAQTRSYCLFPNDGLKKILAPIQRLADKHGLIFEGELYEHGLVYYVIQGAVMSYAGDLRGITFHAFDCLSAAEWEGESVTPYHIRLKMLRKLLPANQVIDQIPAADWAEVQAIYRRFIAAGYEGAMIRRRRGLYFHRRCKPAERELFRLKQTETFDGQVIKLREKGITARLANGAEINLRLSAENRREAQLGAWVEFAGTNYGARHKPRFGRFLRWRLDRQGVPHE